MSLSFSPCVCARVCVGVCMSLCSVYKCVYKWVVIRIKVKPRGNKAEEIDCFKSILSLKFKFNFNLKFVVKYLNQMFSLLNRGWGWFGEYNRLGERRGGEGVAALSCVFFP